MWSFSSRRNWHSYCQWRRRWSHEGQKCALKTPVFFAWQYWPGLLRYVPTQIWDLRVKQCQLTIPNRFQITATAFGDKGWVFSSGLDNKIRVRVCVSRHGCYICLQASLKLFLSRQKLKAGVFQAWDTRKPKEPVMELLGHEDTLTGLSVSKNGNFLLSNAMDNTVRAWDLRFVI